MTFLLPPGIKGLIISTKRSIDHICGALRDLVPWVQFKKAEKHPWRSITPPLVSFTVFKLYEWYQIAQSTTYDWQGSKYISVKIMA